MTENGKPTHEQQQLPKTSSIPVAVPVDGPSVDDVISMMDAAFLTGEVPTEEQTSRLWTGVKKLTKEGRGATLDASDPANAKIVLAVL